MEKKGIWNYGERVKWITEWFKFNIIIIYELFKL